MRIFISWSGQLSEAIANVFHEWLPMVIQEVDPYVSSEDIRKGARWLQDIGEKLDQTDFGILCMTRENLNAPWILFEAGALSKFLAASQVCPFLVDVRKSDLQLPLSQFQASEFSKLDIEKICIAIWSNLEDSRLSQESLKRSFEKWWPDFETRIKRAIDEHERRLQSEDEIMARPIGLDEAHGEIMTMLEEIYDALKLQTQMLGSPEKIVPREYILNLANAIQAGEQAPQKFDTRHPAVKVITGVLSRIKADIANAHLGHDEQMKRIKSAADEIENLLSYLSSRASATS
jgi:hypothetical protein